MALSPNELMNFYNSANYIGTANTTPAVVLPKTQTLPNGGGTFNVAEGAKINPAPIFTGPATVAAAATATPAVKKATLYGPNGQKEIVDVGSQRASQLQSQGWVLSASAVKPTVNQIPGVNYDKYRDPKTGEVMTPEQYAIYLGNKVPKGNGEITNYAGDALANPDQTAAELQARATKLNNSRNDIATGATDPYSVGNKSGIAYSPTELAAIEKAYVGIYDPALSDVFARLKSTQEEEKAKANLVAAKDLEVFKTNEAIRQWRATTGTKKTGTGKAEDLFTDTQLNNAARNAGVSVAAIRDMDPDLINFFISPPKAKRDDGTTATINAIFNEDFQRIVNGETTADEVVSAIEGSTLSEPVKHYFIDQIPAEPAEKEGWLSRVWGGIKGLL